MSSNLLPPQEAAKKVGVSTRTLRRWKNRGLINPVPTPGGKTVYNPNDLEKLKSQKNQPLPPKPGEPPPLSKPPLTNRSSVETRKSETKNLSSSQPPKAINIPTPPLTSPHMDEISKTPPPPINKPIKVVPPKPTPIEDRKSNIENQPTTPQPLPPSEAENMIPPKELKPKDPQKTTPDTVPTPKPKTSNLKPNIPPEKKDAKTIKKPIVNKKTWAYIGVIGILLFLIGGWIILSKVFQTPTDTRSQAATSSNQQTNSNTNTNIDSHVQGPTNPDAPTTSSDNFLTGERLRLTPITSPKLPKEGDQYYDSTTSSMKYFNGTTWIDLSGSATGSMTLQKAYEGGSIIETNKGDLTFIMDENSNGDGDFLIKLTGDNSELIVSGGGDQDILTINDDAIYPVDIAQSTRIAGTLFANKFTDTSSSSYYLDPASNTTSAALAGGISLGSNLTFSQNGEIISNGTNDYITVSAGLSLGGETTYYFDKDGDINANQITLSSNLDANGQVDLGDGGDAVNISGSTMTLASTGGIDLKPSNDNDDYIYFSTTSSSPSLSFAGISTTNDPGIRVNSTTGEIEYRDEDSSVWITFDSLGGASSLLTDGGSTVYLTDTANDFAVGGTTLASPFSVDESANTIRFGDGSSGNAVLSLYGSDGDTGSLTYNTSDTFAFSGGAITSDSTFTATGAITGGSLVTTGTTTLNGVAYTWPGSDGTGGYVLSTNGSGTLSWVAQSGGGGGGESYWTLSGTGVIYPTIQTLDLLAGGSATTSAKFAVLNMATGTPTASISGSTTNVATYLTGEGNLATTNMAPLSIGGATTGAVTISEATTITGSTTLSSTLGVTGATTLNNTLTVTGATDLQGDVSDSLGNLVLADTIDIGSATTGLNITTAGLITDIDGNVIIGDEIDLGSATTGLNITTAGLITDIDGNIVLGDEVDLGSATTGINITTTGVISDTDGNVSISDTVNITGGLTTTTDADFEGALTSGTGNAFNVDASGNIDAGTWTADTIGADYGGTGLSSYTIGDLIYADGATSLTTLADVAVGSVLLSGGVATAPSWGQVTLGTHTTGNYVSTITGTANQITASGSTGDITLSLPSDLRAPGTFNAVSGLYTGATAGTQRIDASGNLVNIGTTQLNGVTYTWPGADGVGGYVLSTNGGGTLSWVAQSGGGGGTNYWNIASGAIYPLPETLDFLLGDTATASAKFAVLNMATGTPTASISGSTTDVATYITGEGLLATTNMAPLTIGNATTGHLILNPGLNVGIGTLTPSYKLEVDGDIGITTSNDLYIGDIGLNDVGTSEADSGASLIGAFDEFATSTGTNLQDILDDIDNEVTYTGRYDRVVDATGAGTDTTIQDAIDNASAGDVIFIMPGTYYEHITIDLSNITLIGAGRESTRIQSTTDAPLVTITGALIDIVIKDMNLYIDDGVDGDDTAIYVDTSINGLNVDNLDINSQFGSIHIVSGSNISVTNSKLHVSLSTQDNIDLNSVTDSVFDNNEISNGSPTISLDSSSDNVIISNNIITGYTDLLVTGGADYLTITGNSFSGGIRHGAYFNSSSTNSIISNNTFESVGSGADDYGIYVTSCSNITISGNIIYDSGDDGMRITSSSYLTILGNTISNNGVSSAETSNGIYLFGTSDHLTITGNTFSANTNYGIGIQGSDDLENSVVSHNTFKDNTVGDLAVNSSPQYNNTIGPNTLEEDSDYIAYTYYPTTGNTFSNDLIQLTLDGADADSFQGNGLHMIVDASQNTGNFVLFEDDATTDIFSIDESGNIYTTGNIGIADTSADALIDITGTTEQLRLSYEVGDTNYASFTLDLNGDLTIAPTGADTTITGDLIIGGSGTTTFNGVEYTWPASDAASSGYVLTSDALGNLSWAEGGGTTYWTESLGALYPNNATLDLLIGGTASDSAKFAVLNMNTGTPTASISGTTSNVATYLTGEGNLATTNMAPLVLGGTTTGDITSYENLLPDTDDTLNLGSSSLRWANAYIGPGSLHIGSDGDDSTISYSTGSDLLTFQNSADAISGFQFLDADGGTSILNIDTTNERVGIGTNNPGINLETIRDYASDGNTSRGVAFFSRSYSGGVGSAGIGARIDFRAESDSEGSLQTAGRIGGILTNVSDSSYDGALTFDTSNNGSASEKMRIDSLGNVGINDTTPDHKLDIEGYYGGNALMSLNDTGGNDIFTASASGTTRFRIGTDGYTYAQRFVDIANESYYIDPAASGTSINIDGDITSNGAFTIDSNGNNNITIDAGSGTVVIGSSGTGKLDSGTIDPPYMINGQKYATYLSSMIGVKEETTGTVNTSDFVNGVGYRHTIDFTSQPIGSDLWLFGETSDLRSHIDKLSILLSPAGNTRAWYELDTRNYKLHIYSTSPTQVSYRLTAPRFDANTWSNERDSASTGFILNNNGEWDENLSGTTIGYTSSLENIVITPDYQLTESFGNIIQSISSYSESIIGKLTAGLINARRVVVEELVVDGQDIANLIVSTVQSAFDSGELVSPLSDIDTIQANIEFLESNLEQLGQLEIRNSSFISTLEQEVSSQSSIISNQSSNISSQSSRIATLENIQNQQQKEIDELNTYYSLLTTDTEGVLPDPTLEGESDLEQLEISDLQDQYASISAQIADIQFSAYDNIASSSTDLDSAFIANLNVDVLSASRMAVINDNLMLTRNSLQTISNDTIYIQPAGGNINLAQSLMTLSPDGNSVTINGDVLVNGNIAANNLELEEDLNVKGVITANTIQPTFGELLDIRLATASALDIYQDLDTDPSASINSSGSATFSGLNLPHSTGIATLFSADQNITVSTETVNKDSQVFVTFSGDYSPATKYWVTTDWRENTFTIHLNYPVASPVDISWMIIN